MSSRNNPNNPKGGRQGGSIFEDYGIDQWWEPTARTRVFPRGSNGCDFNYMSNVRDAQFRFNQCVGILDDRGSLISGEEMRQVCQATLNNDLNNAQLSFGQCRNSLPSIPIFF